MSAQFKDFDAFGQQVASTAARLNKLALENAETAFGLGLKTLERNVGAVTEYIGELARARDLDSYTALWPKGLQVARDSAERIVAANEEVVGMTLKTGEALGELAKSHLGDGARPRASKTK